MQPEAGLHLIEDQHRAHLVTVRAKFAQPLDIGDHLDQRFHDDCGKPVACSVKLRMPASAIVERQVAIVGMRASRNTGCRSPPIEPPEVAAAQNEVAARVRTCDANGGGTRLGTGLQEAHLLCAWH